MSGKFRRVCGAGPALFLLMLCLRPDLALEASLKALTLWAGTVAPALLPFLALCPAVAGGEAGALLGRMLRAPIRRLRCPSGCAGALAMGLLGGGVAGAAALSRAPSDPAAPPGAWLRAALLCPATGPAFLLSALSAGMLGRPEWGPVLLRSQLLSCLITGLLLRRVGSSRPALLSAPAAASRGVMAQAIHSLLLAGGYMALFSALARLVAHFLGFLPLPSLETPLLALLELTGGCAALARLPLPPERALPLISATAGFGSLSLCAQSMALLRPLGVDGSEFLAGRLIQGSLCALLTRVQLASIPLRLPPLEIALLLGGCLLLAGMAQTIRRWRGETRESDVRRAA